MVFRPTAQVLDAGQALGSDHFGPDQERTDPRRSSDGRHPAGERHRGGGWLPSWASVTAPKVALGEAGSGNRPLLHRRLHASSSPPITT